MPLLRTGIAEALREAGISSGSSDSENIKESLDRNGLSLDETLQLLGNEMVSGETSASRIRAAEVSVKLRGLMKETNVQLPSINIIISDPSAPTGINPILLPREIKIG